MNNFGEKVNFLWSIAELLRDRFKRGKYQDVILPFTVLRRIDCVLAPTKEKVLETHAKLKGKLENLEPQLRKASGFAFYNTSKYDFEKLLDDPPSLATNLRTYFNGFSDNMREVLDKFDFPNTIAKLDEHGLLFLVMERFASSTIDLHPDKVGSLEMGYIFEELVRRFNEALDENPGEHFTPREIVRLMALLLISVDKEVIKKQAIVRTVCDLCCGTGGMLTTTKDQILEINPNAEVHMFGHESQPETFAICKADLYMKSLDGRDADNIKFGSTLSNWQLGARCYDYQAANPPYGKDWKLEQAAVEAEAERGHAGRFGAGLPRISDGQLLFLQHMLSRMKDPKEGGGRVAIVMNGSPLFTGDAGSGESEIRRWVLQNDWLEAIIALPEQLFYNTGISTYIWILSNRKEKRRKSKVQLIDASGFWIQMRKSLGNKRREISADQIKQVLGLYTASEAGEHSRIFDSTEFGYRKITIERPLRLNFLTSAERLERLVSTLQGVLKLKPAKAGTTNRLVSTLQGASPRSSLKAGHQTQAAILKALRTVPDTLFKDRAKFMPLLDGALKKADLKLGAPVRKATLSALAERDETAEICRDDDGQPEPDPELRDTENVPLTQDIHDYFDREVKPHVPDAWINASIRDHQDGEIGKVGYEINFNRYFYQYQPPRPLGEIGADIKALEKDIMEMLRDVAG